MSSIKRRHIEEKQQQASDDHVHEMKDLINTLSLDSLAQIFMLLPISERLLFTDEGIYHHYQKNKNIVK